jgi:hypothetical protein
MDFGKHMALGSALLRILARKFCISGFANHAIGGLYFKSLFNPHPDPQTHLYNFCIKINSSGQSHLQEALIKLKLDKVVSTNFLLSIANATNSEYRKGSQPISNKQVAEKCEKEVSHDGATPSPGRRERRTPITRRLDELCATVKLLVDRDAKVLSITPNEHGERSRSKGTSSADIGKPIQQNNEHIRPNVHENTCSSKDSGAVEQHAEKTKENSNKISSDVSIDRSKTNDANGKRINKRVASGSVTTKPTSKRNKLQVAGVPVDHNFMSRLLDDFGGGLYEMPHGKGDLSDYDSDYFERNEKTLNTARKKLQNSNGRKK